MHAPVLMPRRSVRVALPHRGRVQTGVRDRRGGVRSQGGDSIAFCARICTKKRTESPFATGIHTYELLILGNISVINLKKRTENMLLKRSPGA